MTSNISLGKFYFKSLCALKAYIQTFPEKAITIAKSDVCNVTSTLSLNNSHEKGDVHY